MDDKIEDIELPINNKTMANWLQDSINRHFDKVPPARPYMLPEKVYDFLKKAENDKIGKVNRKDYSRKTYELS